MPENEKTPIEIADEKLKDLEERSEGQLEGLSDRISGSFWDRMKSFFMLLYALQWEGGQPIFESTVKGVWETWKKGGEPFTEEDITALVKDLHGPEFTPATSLKGLQDIADKVPIIGMVFKLLYLASSAVGMGKAELGAAWETATQAVMTEERPSLLPLDAAIEAFYKDPQLKAEVKDVLNRMGLSDAFQDMLWTATETPLDAEMSRDAFLREEITEPELDSILKSHHLSDIDIEVIKRLYKIIPPVQDIITMAVREVFTPDVVERFGQMQDFPEEFGAWAKQKGLSDYWAKAYWAAHWILPSIGQGFEMLHRRVIDDSDLDLLLRALDVMPFWREKLKDISYNPLTRVDVRRMHRIGVIDEDGVFDAYLDVGYNEDNARLMTEFTVAFNQESERELTKTDILALYKKFAIERDAAKVMLMGLAYQETTAELLLVRADLEIYATYKKEQIGYIKAAYVAGKIEEGETLSRLGKLDLPSTETNNLMESWELARRSKVKELSLDNLKAFFAEKVITEDELRIELGEIGYNDQDIGRFVTLFGKAAKA